MRIIAFHQSAFEQYNDWALRDKETFERLKRLIAETARTPFAGIGKPEPLKHERLLVAPNYRPGPSCLSGH